MSTEIEKRIVEMEFNNKGFANGVKDTLNDLDRLDKSMSFSGGREGLKNLQNSIDEVKFNKLMTGIDSIGERITSVTSFAGRTIENLERRLGDTLINTVKKLSVDQIGSGFKEYELKMDSVKTIMNSSKKPLKEVNRILAELNDYSDKTIYSFSDMTSSIGKFTNAGVELDKAVLAIKGISNEAAVSGANAADASRAMYNFSQALSSGYVKLIDWKSIENANMATKDFKNQLIQTAVELGTVKKEGNAYVSVTTDAKGAVSDAFDAVMKFNDSLSAQWLTSDVLVTTLAKYADETTDFGKAAYAAASEVTTFSKMMDALEESVGSGWAETWELLFGDLEEAKKLWTGINNVISGFISRVADTRNGILRVWKAANKGGLTDLHDGFKNIYGIVKNIAHYVGLAFETLFGHRYLQNFDDMKKFFSDDSNFSGNLVVIKKVSSALISMTSKFKDFTDYLYKFFDYTNNIKSRWFLEEIYQATQSILIPLRFIYRLVSGLAGIFIPLIAKGIAGAARLVIWLMSRVGYALTEGGLQHKLYDLADNIVQKVSDAVDWILEKVNKGAKWLYELLGVKGPFEALEKIGGLIKRGFSTGINSIKKFGSSAKNVFSKVKTNIGKVIDHISEKFTNLKKGIDDFMNNSKVGEFSNKVTSAVGAFADDKGPKILDIFAKIENKAKELVTAGVNIEDTWGKAKKVIEGISIKSIFEGGSEKGSTLFQLLSSSKPVEVLKDLLKQFTDFIGKLPIVERLKTWLGPIVEAFKESFGDIDILANLKEIGALFTNLFTTISSLSLDLGPFDYFKAVAGAIGEFIAAAVQLMGTDFSSFFTRLENFWSALFPEDQEIDNLGTRLFKTVSSAVTKALHGLVDGIFRFDWDGTSNILKGLFSLFIIKKVIDVLTIKPSIISSAKKSMNEVARITENLAGISYAYKWDVVTRAFNQFVAGVLKLVGGMVVLAEIPEDDAYRALSIIAILGVICGAFLILKAKFLEASPTTENKIADNLKEFAQNIEQGLMQALGKLATGASKALRAIGNGALILGIAIAITALVTLMEQLKGITMRDLVESIEKVARIAWLIVGIYGAITAISYLAGNDTPYFKITVFLLGITQSIKTVAHLVEYLSGIPTAMFLDGIEKLALIETVVAAFVGVIELIAILSKLATTGVGSFDPANVLMKLAGSVAVFSLAVVLLAGALILLAAIPPDRLKSAVSAIGGIAVALGIIIGATALLQKLKVSFKSFIEIAGGVVLLALGIDALIFGLVYLAQNADIIAEKVGIIRGALIGLVVLLGIMAIIAAIPLVAEGILMIGGAVALIGAGFFLGAAAVKLFADAIIELAENMNKIVDAVKGSEEDVTNAISVIVGAAAKGLMDSLVYLFAAIVIGLDEAIIVFDEHAWSLGYHLGSACSKFVVGFVAGLFQGLIPITQAFIDDSIENMWDGVTKEGVPRHVAESFAQRQSIEWDEATKQYILPEAAKSGNEAADAMTQAYVDELNNTTVTDENNPLLQAIRADQNSRQEAYDQGSELADSTINGYTDTVNANAEKVGTSTESALEKSKSATLDNIHAWEQQEGVVKDSANAVTESADQITSATDLIMGQAEGQSTAIQGFLGNIQNEINTTVGSFNQLDTSNLFDSLSTSAETNSQEAQASTETMVNNIGQQYQGLIDQSGITGQLSMEGITETLNQYSSLPIDSTQDLTDEMLKIYSDADWAGTGEDIDTEIAKGEDNKSGVVSGATDSVVDEALRVANNKASESVIVGENMTGGVAQGVRNKSGELNAAARDVINDALTTMQNTADEHSPSRITKGYGVNLILGWIKGITSSEDKLYESAEASVNGMLGAIRNAMASIPSIMDEQIEYTPAITPVIDSTGVEYGMRGLNSILSGGSMANIRANLDVNKVDVGSAVGELSSLTSRGNSDLLDALRLQNRQNAHLIELLENQKIYLDGNTLVGGTISKIDNALGQRTILAGRRG